MPCLQQAVGHGRREVCRLPSALARGAHRRPRRRRPALHRRPRLRPGLQRQASGRSARARRRKTEGRPGGQRGAGRPSGGGHAPRQRLHPATRQRRRPACHHHQRLQGGHFGLSRGRARPRSLLGGPLLRCQLPRRRAHYRALVADELAERHQRRRAMDRHHGGAQRRQPGGRHGLSDPRDHQGLETRRLFRRGVECRQAAGAQLRRRGERRRWGRRPVGDRHRHRSHELHRPGRLERLCPLAADGAAPGRRRSRGPVARQRTARQGDHGAGRPGLLSRRPAERPRRRRTGRRHGAGFRQEGVFAP